MTRVEEIEKAVSNLPPEQLAKFRVWFEEFEAHLFDDRISEDVRAGKLDRLADAALAEYRKGQVREL